MNGGAAPAKRPALADDLDPAAFDAHYWLKEELAAFLRSHGASASGSKAELTVRVRAVLAGETAAEKDALRPPRSVAAPLTSRSADASRASSSGKRAAGARQAAGKAQPAPDGLIPSDYRNDEAHRAFLKQTIGPRFRFNVPFMAWMRANAGKARYSDAVAEWLRLEVEGKSSVKRAIGPQFEFNRYTRAFHAANPGRSRADCLKCWKAKKELPGSRAYEDSDLQFLESHKIEIGRG